MRHRRKARTSAVIPLDPEETLYEVKSKDVWQSLLTTADGEEVGPVIRQVVEPKMSTIRYLVVYDVQGERHVLLPSNTIVDISNSRVLSSLDKVDIQQMPSFHQAMTRRFEEDIYQAVGRTPYWVEEAAAMAKTEGEPSKKDHPEP